MSYRELTWDSEFFQRKVVRIDLSENSSGESINKLIAESKADTYYIFSQNKNSELIKLGAKLVDEKITYSRKVNDSQINIPDTVSAYQGGYVESLLDLAFISGNHSRFKLDEKLSSKFKEMYTIWLKRSIAHEIADEVYIYKTDNTIYGFVTLKKHENLVDIGLIAVANDQQGKGIGSSLIKAVNAWAIKNNLQEITVVTQAANVQACNFYNRNGFEIKQKDHIYHYHLT